jgi:hypothetical protein
MCLHFCGDKPTEEVKVEGQEFTDNRGIIKYAKKRVKKISKYTQPALFECKIDLNQRRGRRILKISAIWLG